MIWSAVLGSWLIAGCQHPTERATNSARHYPPSSTAPLPVRRSQPLLGTFVTITVYSADESAAQTAITAAFDEFRHVDALMSIHRKDSELSSLNQSAAQRPVAVSRELFDVLAAAQEIARRTEGAFDVTIGPLTQLWGFIWKEYRLPTEVELAATLPRIGYRHVELDPVPRTVQFRRAGISLDLGGIGKGYAVDRAIEKLRSLGFTNAMVKAGGDLRVIGSPPGLDDWEVQLEDPRKKGRRVTVPLRDAALSTSGNYENFFEAGGKRYSHIIDPRTGLPVQGVAACTVITPTCIESDAWATACFVYGVEKSLKAFGDRMAIRFTLVPAHGNDWSIRSSPRFPVVHDR